MRLFVNHRKTVLFGIAALLPFVNVSAQTNAAGVGASIAILLFLGLSVFAIVHMVYVLVKGKPYKVEFTPDYFREKRRLKIEAQIAAREKAEQDAQDPKNAGKEQPVIEISPDEPDDDERALCYDLLEQAFDSWTVISRPGEEELRTPTKMKQIRKTRKLLNRVIALCPFDEDIINRLNELCNIINISSERSFDGSKMLVGISVVVAIISIFLDDSYAMVSMIGSGIVLYWLASRTPQFLIEKRAERGGGNIFTGILGGAFAAVATAKTYKTVTKWSDGTTTTDYDHSETWISLVLMVIVCLVLACLMFFWAMLNYLRNYVFYF